MTVVFIRYDWLIICKNLLQPMHIYLYYILSTGEYVPLGIYHVQVGPYIDSFHKKVANQPCQNPLTQVPVLPEWSGGVAGTGCARPRFGAQKGKAPGAWSNSGGEML